MTDPLRHATLRQLQIFLVAAEHSSFSRAAEILHLTRPAVSMQMSQLSASIGLGLFEKRGRRLALTLAGEMLLPYIERVARTLREAGAAIDSLQVQRRGKLRIGLVTTTRYFAPRLVAQFRELHPEIEVEVDIADREAVVARLASHHLDLAIMGRPPTHLDLEAEVFARHPHGIIAPAGHALAGRPRLAPGVLVGEPFLAREPGCGTRHAMDQFFAEHQLKPPLQDMS